MPSKKNTVRSGEQPPAESNVLDVEESTPEDTGSPQENPSPSSTENSANQSQIDAAQAQQKEALEAVMLLPAFMRNQAEFNKQVGAQLGEIAQVKGQLQAIVDAYQKQSGGGQAPSPQGGGGGGMNFAQPRQPSGDPNDLARYADPMRSGVLGGQGGGYGGGGGQPGSLTGSPVGDMIVNSIIGQTFPQPGASGGMGNLGEMIMKMALQSFQDDISLSRDLRAAIKRKITADVVKDTLGVDASKDILNPQPQVVAPVQQSK